MSEKKVGRKVAFWGAVGVVSILSNFVLELAASKVPSEGLKRFVEFTHQGAN